MMEVIPENLIPEDDSFDEDFCKDIYRIKNFLHGDKYEIKNNEMSKDLIDRFINEAKVKVIRGKE